MLLKENFVFPFSLSSDINALNVLPLFEIEAFLLRSGLHQFWFFLYHLIVSLNPSSNFSLETFGFHPNSLIILVESIAYLLSLLCLSETCLITLSSLPNRFTIFSAIYRLSLSLFDPTRYVSPFLPFRKIKSIA